MYVVIAAVGLLWRKWGDGWASLVVVDLFPAPAAPVRDGLRLRIGDSACDARHGKCCAAGCVVMYLRGGRRRRRQQPRSGQAICGLHMNVAMYCWCLQAEGEARFAGIDDIKALVSFFTCTAQHHST